MSRADLPLPRTRQHTEDFDRLTDPDFWETGASGHRYSREYVWSILEQRYTSYSSDPRDQDWHTSEFHLREIAPATYLLTYPLQQDTKLTRRATIWQWRERDWTVLYHQGTLVSDPTLNVVIHHPRVDQ
ncbi:DUF4440 domain-containing protein [Rhodococcus sp. MS16]|uniref:nuclear transport factor 2 family protein n=1 Tax=Rhodococcus sp. MS16 TaxID=2579941 RepID=UPI001F5B6AA7|nr:DUF4440 domain-containing protein [Rhodococcus sp. MS16]